MQIERGNMQTETFKKAIEDYTRQITSELLAVSISPSFGGGQGEACLCPKCKVAKVLYYPKVVKCTGANCGLLVFRSVSEKLLSDKQITDLLTNGKTGIIKGFKSKTGKTFDAALKFDDNFKVTYEFPERNGKN
jgi:DNA topoisomerase-3